MAAKTQIEIQNDARGRIVYDRTNKDHAVYTPCGQLLNYVKTIGAATDALNAWHYAQRKQAA
jgi:hypothetical protein